MASNDTQSILDGLIFTAMNKWNVTEEQILENMNKIAFHESKLDPSAIQKVAIGTAEDGSTVYGEGRGRGLFQFELGKNQGANTAINRLVRELEGYEPDFLKQLDKSNYDVSVLSPEAQQAIFLGNILQMPNKEEEGYGLARFEDKDGDKKISNQELAEYWAQYHQAGTKPGTQEYKDIINKFLSDMPYFK